MFENFDWIGAMRTSPVMLIILGCSVLTFGFAIERSIYFWKRRHAPDQLIAKVTEQYSGADVDALVERAKEYVLTEYLETRREREITPNSLRVAVESARYKSGSLPPGRRE